LSYGDMTMTVQRRQSATFATRSNPAGNNFDLLGAFLAAVVAFCHCFSLKSFNWKPVGGCFRCGYGGMLAV